MMKLGSAKPRNKKVTGLAKAKRIGILYDATDREVFEYVRELIQDLRTQHKEVNSLGFVNVKHEEEIPKSKLGMDFFGPKSLNFSLKSSATSVSNFVGDAFDMLFDLNMDENPVLLNITADSRSPFIVGKGDAGKPYRDLYFELPEKNGQPETRESRLKELHTLIENIKKYTADL